MNDTSHISAPSAVDLLQRELEWARARILRIARNRQEEGFRGTPFRGYEEENLPSLETLLQREAEALAAFEAARARCATPVGLDALVARFGLDPVERATLLLAVGIAVDRRVGTWISELEMMGSVVTPDTVLAFVDLRLDARIEARRRFLPRATLFAEDLAELNVRTRYTSPEQLLDAQISITSRGLELMLGNTVLVQEYADFSTLQAPHTTFEQVVLPPSDQRRILSVVDHAVAVRDTSEAWGVHDSVRHGRGLLFLFTGAPGTGKTSTAHAIAHRLGRRVLQVDIPTFVGHADALRFLPGLFREARLHDALLFFDECETLFETRRNGNALMTLLLTELEHFEGVAVLATNLPERLDPALDRRVRVRVDFGKPDGVSRESIWRMLLPPRAVLDADVDLAGLARRYDLTGGYIKNAVLNAVAAAVTESPAAPVLRQAHLDAAARDQMRRPAPCEDGARLQEPRATLEDVFMPEAQRRAVQEIVAASNARRTVFERWRVAARQSGGRGVVALFHGAPGTGKTLCAEAIAGELGRPLLRVVLPTVLSRWVGEAERMLARVFSDASSHDAVLLLDEVDGLLMARGRGQASRHDDSVVNALLDLLDRHEGVVLLCTNRPEVLDSALDRRLAWRVAFPEPDAAARAAIWRTLVPPSATGGRALDMHALAAQFPLTGGRLRNAAVRAASRAASEGRRLTLSDLAGAASEELGEGAPSRAVTARVATGWEA